MNKSKKIGIIGCGNMGEALIKGITKSGVSRGVLIVSDKDKKRRDYIRKKYAICVTSDNLKAVNSSNIVVLAVKPQDMGRVLAEIKQKIEDRKQKLFISIAAGITTKYIEGFLRKVKVIRVMPNAPVLIGCGISAVCLGKYAKNKDYRKAEKIFKLAGEVVQVKESLINKITAVSGSGPAYFFLFIKHLTNSAVKIGLDKKTAKQLVDYTALGSIKMLIDTKEDIDKLVNNVASRGGTTEAALKVFKDKKLENTINLAVKAAVKKAEELDKRRD